MQKALVVDGACSGNPGPIEFRGVDLDSRKVVFHQAYFQKGTNNIAEFLALVSAIQYCTATPERRQHYTAIYSDSNVAITWVEKSQGKIHPQADPFIADLVHKANTWLKNNAISIPIRKWQTHKWGENPADFNRK